MAQLDKIIRVMLDQPNAEISLAAGAEPMLRVEGSSPHTLINRKLAAPHLRLLLGELVGEQAVPQLEASDGGEFTYTLSGQGVSIHVRAWSGNVEARLRPAAKRGTAAVARIELTKAPAARLAGAGAALEPKPRAPEPSRNDGLELDLAGALASRDIPAALAGIGASDLEVDLNAPPPPSSRGDGAPSREPKSETKGAVTEVRVDPKGAVGEPPINALFRAMVKQGGSDLHLSAGERPMIRKDGDMVRLDEQAARLRGDQVMELMRPIMPPTNLTEFEADHDTDFAYEIAGVSRFRGNAFMDRRGVSAVFRTIPTEIVTVEKLSLSPAIQNLCYLSKGLVLVTGPTGSGKSTTLSALIDLINRTRHDHVITIEDPIEFVHPNKSCLINQRQVGNHTNSFKRALRAALREDPDVVMVGEMRDLETMAIAMETAETGHLVFGTLHTSTAYSTIDRLIDSFPSDRQAQIRVMLSESLKGVVSQALCKKIGGGRIAAHEVLLVNSAIANLIREGKTFQVPSLMQTARKQGMVLLNDALYELVDKKKVEPREAYIKAIDKPSFVAQLKAGGHKLEFLGQGG
ncbi:MAG TPA: type IV pilus twitching motility protein PilT [Polyangiaceae bacterium]|jgi:twitching motility protein PilT